MAITPSEYERLAESMLSVYEQAELTMIGRVAKRLAKGVDTPGWTEKKYAEIGAARKEILAAVTDLKHGRKAATQEIIQSAYSAGAQSFASEAEKFTNVLGITSISPNAKKVASIIAELDDTLNAAERVILRRANDTYTTVIGNASAQLATGTITSRQAVQNALNDFARRGISTFVDKAGRAWEMFNYAEMATITAIENATLAGYTDTMKSYGFDLAVISSHAGACPLCVAWEGVIVSVSGDDSRYPSLDDARAGGAFHPRCLHHLSTYYEGISRGTRSAPRKVQAPSANYTTRQKQRYYEHQVRIWKRRMAAAISPEEQRYAYAKVRDYQERIRNIVETAPATICEWLPRKYWREGGRVVLSDAARRLKPVVLSK